MVDVNPSQNKTNNESKTSIEKASTVQTNLVFGQGQAKTFFDAKRYDIWINTVNCVGVMGKGLALEFKKREPAMFDAYVKYCSDHKLQPGGIMEWKRIDGKFILNVSTKNHWKDVSKLEWIHTAILELKKWLLKHCHPKVKTTIAMPALGCSNGGLSWSSQVCPLIKQLLLPDLAMFDVTIDLFPPNTF